MNAKDGCFECSIDGPDHYQFPFAARLCCHDTDAPLPNIHPTDYYGTARSRPKPPANQDRTPHEYRRIVRHPTLAAPPTAQKRNYQSKTHPPWTAPGAGYQFTKDELKFRVVYVEDTEQRTFVDKEVDSKMVAIPFLNKASE